jgi:hypothetical protein
MTVALPMPADDASDREWALYLSRDATRRGAVSLAVAWEVASVRLSPLKKTPEEMAIKAARTALLKEGA